MNKAILIGRLGKDPETKYTHDGSAVTNFSLATDERYKDKNGEKVQKTEWHNITAFGKLAEICTEWLRKGSQVMVEGKIQRQEWEDKEGQKHNKTIIVINQMEMLGGKRDGADVPVDQPAPVEDIPF